MHICVWSLGQGALGQTRPRGTRSDCTGCRGSRRQRSPSAARWSAGSHSNLEDTHRHHKALQVRHQTKLCHRFKVARAGSHRPEAWGQCTPGHPPPPTLVSDRCLHEPGARPVPPEPCTALWWTELRAGPTPGSAPAAWARRCPLSSSGLQEQQNPAGHTWSSNLLVVCGTVGFIVSIRDDPLVRSASWLTTETTVSRYS